MQLSDKKEKFASPLGREKSGDGRNPSPTFGRRTSRQEEMENESQQFGGKNPVGSIKAEDSGLGFDVDESVGLADLLDQLKVDPGQDKIDALLSLERNKMDFSKKKNVKESSDFFDDFDDYSARKSNISSVSGISRRPIGLDQFDDFEDFDDSEDSMDDFEQFQDKSPPKSPKFQNIHPALGSDKTHSSKSYHETGRDKIQSNETISLSSGSSEAIMQEDLDIQSEDEQKICLSESQENNQKSGHLTLDLSFADNSPYFSVQEDSSKFRNTLTDKLRPSDKVQDKMLDSGNVFSSTQKFKKKKEVRRARFGKDKYFDSSGQPQKPKEPDSEEKPRSKSKSKQELIVTLKKQEAEITKYKNNYNTLLEQWREEMEKETNFESRRVSMMKESLSRTGQRRAESMPIDTERRNSCRSLIGGYEGFKNLKKTGYEAPPKASKKESTRRCKIKEFEVGDSEYNLNLTQKVKNINSSKSKYKLDTSKFSSSLRKFTSGYKDKPKKDRFNQYTSFDFERQSLNQPKNREQVNLSTTLNTTDNKKVDRFLRDFDSVKNRINTGTSFLQDWNQRKKELGLDLNLKTSHKNDPFSKTFTPNSKPFKSSRVDYSQQLSSKPEPVSRRTRQNSQSKKSYSVDPYAAIDLKFTSGLSNNQSMYKSKYLNETLNSRSSRQQVGSDIYSKYSSASKLLNQPKIVPRQIGENSYFEPNKFKTIFQKKSPSSYIDKYLNRIKVEKNLFEEENPKKINEFEMGQNTNFYRSMNDKMYNSGAKQTDYAKTYRNLKLNFDNQSSNLPKYQLSVKNSKPATVKASSSRYTSALGVGGLDLGAYSSKLDRSSGLESNVMRRSGYKVRRRGPRNSAYSGVGNY